MTDIPITFNSLPSSSEPITLNDFESKMQVEENSHGTLRRRMTSPLRHMLRHRQIGSLSELDAKDMKRLLHGRSLSPKPMMTEEANQPSRKDNLFTRPYTPYLDKPRCSDLYSGNEFDIVDLRSDSYSTPDEEAHTRNPFALTDSLLDSDSFVDNTVAISWRDLVQNRDRLETTKTKRCRRKRNGTPTSMDIDSNDDSSEQDNDNETCIRKHGPARRRIFTRKTARPDTTANIFAQDVKKEDDTDYSMLYY